ncbi:plasmid IncI1-type surface exclusion protein ExcA [Sodalis endosymbiont of Spalangia cameroni]|uniref:plasmid IncI1-type surface exclusion protein ExcA n=1 Tax=Sodalis praecaptivus TaxID=1239307 RepID=UPI0031F7B10C
MVATKDGGDTMVMRLKTPKETLWSVIKILYMLFALPFSIIITIISVFMAPSLIEEGAYSTLFFFFVIWMGAIVPIALFIYGVITRRRILKIITNDIKHPDFFMPEPGYEMFHEGDGKYLGIDIQRGTILYVHRIRKGEVDVVGLDMPDWTNREVEGKMFRLYTRIPQLPRIEIATPWAQRWFDTLGSMEFKQYSPSLPFSEYVDIHLEQLEREQHIAIPRLA